MRCALLTAACAALWSLPAPRPPAPPLPPSNGLVSIDGILRAAASSRALDARHGTLTRRFEFGSRSLALTLPASDRDGIPAGPFRVRGLAYFTPARGDTGPRLRASARTLEFVRPIFSVWELRASARRFIQASFQRLSPRVRGFALRLLFGHGDLDSGDRRAHGATGLAHLLAISGLHAFFVASLVHVVLTFVVPLPWLRLSILACVLISYAWLCDARAPVVRAVTAYLAWTTARTRGRTIDLAAILTLAATISFVLCRERLDSVSLRLSFAAVIGIASLARSRRQGTRLRDVLDVAVRVSAAAWLATAAFVLESFGTTSPWGILLTPFAVPGVLAVLGLSIAVAVTALVLPGLSEALLVVLELVGRAQLDLVSAAARLPGTPVLAITLPPLGFASTVWILGAVLAGVLRSRVVFALSCGLAVLPFFVPATWRAAALSSAEELHLLAVGHGQCVFARLRGQHVVVDCGDRNDGERAVARLVETLRASGRNRIDTLVLTHGDSDHVSGVPALLDRVRVGRVFMPEHPKLAEVQRRLRARGIPFVQITPGGRHEVAGAVVLQVPLADADLAPSNEGALFCELRFELGARVLVFGDQEEAGCQAARACLTHPGARVDALVVPHHAAVQPALAPLLASLQPNLCLASTSSRRTIDAAWSRAPLRVHRPITTGEYGSLTLRPTDRGLVLESTRR